VTTWTVRYFIVVFAVAAATLAYGALTHPTVTGQCIFEQVYGIGEGKVTQPLPCEWAMYRYKA